MSDPLSIPAGPVGTSPVGYLPAAERERLLRDVLAAAGVELGAYDEEIVSWVASWDWPTVAVISSWIGRAAASGGEPDDAA